MKRLLYLFEAMRSSCVKLHNVDHVDDVDNECLALGPHTAIGIKVS